MLRKTVTLLSPESLDRIHKESLRVLENIGVQCDDVESAEILRRAGAKVLGQTNLVRLPAPMVEEAMAQITKRFDFCSPTGERLWVPCEKTVAGTRVKMPRVLDYGAREARRPVRQDVINVCRITNALKGCGFTLAVQFPSSDVPPEIDTADTMSLLYAVTGKVSLCNPSTVEETRATIDASIAAVGTSDVDHSPATWIPVNTTSPLRLGAKEGSIVRYSTGRHVPIDIEPMAISGGTTPFTLAGTLMVENAEALFLCVLANAVWPGAKIIHSSCANIMNMKAGSISLGSPESCLLSSGELALAQYYGMASFRCGCYTDSYYSDVQSGIEKMAAELLATQSHMDLVVNGGPLHDAAHHSYESVVIDHDIWEFCQRLATEIEVNDETLAYDIIERIGPCGSFLSDEHTMKWLRSGEHYYGGSFNHAGKLGEENTMLVRAHERVRKILAQPFKWGAPPEAVSRIQQFMRDEARDKGVPAPDWALA